MALGFLGVPAAGRDDLAAVEEGVGHRDRLVEQTARIVAKVDDEALELVLADVLLDLVDRFLEAVEGLLVESRHADVADLALDAGADRMDRDDVAHEADIEGLLDAGAGDAEDDRRVDVAAHPVDRLIEVEALDALAVERDDHVAGEDAGPRGRGIVDRGDHLDHPFLHRDFDAQPAELAARLDLHVLEVLGAEIARMGIERGQHAVDGRLDQRAVIRALDIIGADAFEHIAEEIELPVGVGGGRDGRSTGEKSRLGDRHGAESAHSDTGE